MKSPFLLIICQLSNIKEVYKLTIFNKFDIIGIVTNEEYRNEKSIKIICLLSFDN